MIDVSQLPRPQAVGIDEDIADLQRLIHYVELRAYGAARRASRSPSPAATAESLLRKLRHALQEARQLREMAYASGQPDWAI
jgi:hypothetical protein